MPQPTDQDVLQAIQYAVMEPPDLGATWPSGLWTLDEILGYLNTRQSRFLKAGRAWVGQSAPITVLGGQSRVALPEDWILTLSVTWRGSDGTVQILDRVDTFELDHAQDGLWEGTFGVPQYWADYEAPTLQIVLSPLPIVGGTLDLLYVAQGTPLTGDGEVFQVPRLFVDACAKYGALADMLNKDGRGKQPDKAAYAESRYEMGIACARIILDGWV